MKNISYLLKVFCLCVCFFSLVYLYRCGGCVEDNFSFKKRLDKQLKQFNQHESDSLVFKLDSLTDFDWERLYVLNSNNDIDNINQIIEFEWRCESTLLGGIPTFDDDEFIFIFTKEESVVSYAYFRSNEHRLYFEPNIGGHTYLTPQSAILKIIEARDKENRGLGYIELHYLVEQPANIKYFIDRGW